MQHTATKLHVLEHGFLTECVSIPRGTERGRMVEKRGSQHEAIY